MKITAFTSALAATTLAALMLGGCNKTASTDTSTSTSPSTGSTTTTSPMTGASSAASGAASTPP